MSCSLQVLEISFDERPMTAAKNYAQTNSDFSGIIEVIKYKTYQAKKSKSYYYEVINGTVTRIDKATYSEKTFKVDWKARYSQDTLADSKRRMMELLGV